MIKEWTHKALISLLAVLFLCLQTTSTTHSAEFEGDKDHIECSVCHLVSEKSDYKIIQSHVTDGFDNSIKLKKDTFSSISDAWIIKETEVRGPPPRAPPTTLI
jgi:hypothetical protein